MLEPRADTPTAISQGFAYVHLMIHNYDDSGSGLLKELRTVP